MIGWCIADEYNYETYCRIYRIYRINAFSSLRNTIHVINIPREVDNYLWLCIHPSWTSLLMFMHLTEGKDGRLQTFKVIFALVITLLFRCRNILPCKAVTSHL